LISPRLGGGSAFVESGESSASPQKSSYRSAAMSTAAIASAASSTSTTERSLSERSFDTLHVFLEVHGRARLPDRALFHKLSESRF
jgi:hypothetical protein